jgi:ketosteroid isomerase-like protein
MTKNEQLITNAYAGFNARDIDATLLLMHENVKWPRAWEGDFAIGHDEVRDYWTRQWKEIDPKVTPVDFHESENGTLEVGVDQLVRDLDSNIIFDGKVMHVYTISNGLIEQMEIKQLV